MRFSFVVSVDVERQEGKFASRDEIGELIKNALEEADPQTYDTDNGGTYETSNWSVDEELEKVKPKPKPVRVNVASTGNVVVRIRDDYDVEYLRGALVRIVRRSRATGGLTVAFVVACAAYKIGDEINIMPADVESATEAR